MDALDVGRELRRAGLIAKWLCFVFAGLAAVNGAWSVVALFNDMSCAMAGRFRLIPELASHPWRLFDIADAWVTAVVLVCLAEPIRRCCRGLGNLYGGRVTK